jgi:hypothetical protein
MNMHERFAAHEATLVGEGTARRLTWLRSVATRLAAWAKSCADCYAAAAAYDDLSRLSDAQLKHRGLSRDILAREVSQWRDRGSSG